MTREEAKQAIIYRATDYLKPDGMRKGYICPICGSGSGPKGTGITSRDKVHFTCWGGGCFKNADIIDIIGIERGLTDYPAKLEAAANLLLLAGPDGYSGSDDYDALMDELEAEAEREEAQP